MSNEFRSGRSQKSGLGADIDRGQEKKYDTEEAAGVPVAIVNWINAMLEGEPGYTPFPGTDWKSICNHLRGGVVLCHLISKLLKMDGKSPIKPGKKETQSFVALSNIEEFNKACIEYGLAKEFTFQSGDLWEVKKASMINVINGLHSLGFVANNKGAKPAYEGELKKTQ